MPEIEIRVLKKFKNNSKSSEKAFNSFLFSGNITTETRQLLKSKEGKDTPVGLSFSKEYYSECYRTGVKSECYRTGVKHQDKYPLGGNSPACPFNVAFNLDVFSLAWVWVFGKKGFFPSGVLRTSTLRTRKACFYHLFNQGYLRARIETRYRKFSGFQIVLSLDLYAKQDKGWCCPFETLES